MWGALWGVAEELQPLCAVRLVARPAGEGVVQPSQERGGPGRHCCACAVLGATRVVRGLAGAHEEDALAPEQGQRSAHALVQVGVKGAVTLCAQGELEHGDVGFGEPGERRGRVE